MGSVACVSMGNFTLIATKEVVCQIQIVKFGFVWDICPHFHDHVRYSGIYDIDLCNGLTIDWICANLSGIFTLMGSDS